MDVDRRGKWFLDDVVVSVHPLPEDGLSEQPAARWRMPRILTTLGLAIFVVGLLRLSAYIGVVGFVVMLAGLTAWWMVDGQVAGEEDRALDNLVDEITKQEREIWHKVLACMLIDERWDDDDARNRPRMSWWQVSLDRGQYRPIVILFDGDVAARMGIDLTEHYGEIRFPRSVATVTEESRKDGVALFVVRPRDQFEVR